MMEEKHSPDERIRLAWVSTVSANTLDAATWIDTTRELRRQGVDVTLILTGPSGKKTYRGVEVININRPTIYFLGQVIFYLRVLAFLIPRRREYDVVLFHQMAAVWLLALRLFGSNRPRLVMDTRDMPDINDSLKFRLRMAWYRLTIRLVERFADGQTAITPEMAKLVRIPPEQLWGIWPSGVDAERFIATSKARHWPYEGEAIRLIYIGVFTAKRNLLPLCRAISMANAEGMSFTFSLYGGGPQKPDMASVAAGSGGAVRVENPVPHEEIPHLLSLYHVGVTSLPDVDDAKYEASSPIKLFEYMAAGLPILATSNKCHLDVVGDGDYTFWADDVSEETLLATLRRIWRRRSELAELGQKAQNDVHGWTYAANAAKLKAALVYGLKHQGHPRSAARQVPIGTR